MGYNNTGIYRKKMETTNFQNWIETTKEQIRILKMYGFEEDVAIKLLILKALQGRK